MKIYNKKNTPVRCSTNNTRNRKSIKCSDNHDEISMYLGSELIYRGQLYDPEFIDAVTGACLDDEIREQIQEWCNRFGDPFDFDDSPEDAANTFTWIVQQSFDEGQDYFDGDGIIDMEVFKEDYIYSSVKPSRKSIKCAKIINYVTDAMLDEYESECKSHGDCSMDFDYSSNTYITFGTYGLRVTKVLSGGKTKSKFVNGYKNKSSSEINVELANQQWETD